jgi:23S rRNA (guanosine2251-2'-O)-methyltransferase
MDNFSLILPNIRSCHNVGAMFRSADACGVSNIYVAGYTPFPPRKEIDKVSLGAEQWVPWEKRRYLKSLIKELKQAGVAIVALEKTRESVDIGATSFHAPLALIVGNEVDGIRADILRMCDMVVHIPMYGKKESLNVSVAAGIAMYAIRRGILRA